MSKVNHRTYIFIISTISIVLAMACKSRSMNRVVSDYYIKNNESAYDTLGFYKLPELISNLELNDTLNGKYNFPVLPGFDGYSLNLKKNHKFTTYHWSDVPSPFRHHRLRGRWHLGKGELILKSYRGRSYRFIPYKHGLFIFLVPREKSKYFLNEYTKNKNRIDSLSKNFYNNPYPRLDREFRCFQFICFYKGPIKKE